MLLSSRNLRGTFLSLLIVPAIVVACGGTPDVVGGTDDVDGNEGGAGGAPSTPRGGSSGTGNVIIGSGGDDGAAGSGEVDPCDVEDPPPECFEIENPPACGDGLLNQDNERCDDG